MIEASVHWCSDSSRLVEKNDVDHCALKPSSPSPLPLRERGEKTRELSKTGLRDYF